MASITVTSNPSTTEDTLTVNFTTDATNITDILISKDGGNSYTSATSFTNTTAVSMLVVGVMGHIVTVN